MITKEWSLQDAKNKFSAVVDEACQGKAQIVTRRGVPAAAVVSMADFEKLQQMEAQQLPCFTDLLLGMPADDGEFERLLVALRDFN
jgi:prevent-host-death family protein